jgi:hypothetical protein
MAPSGSIHFWMGTIYKFLTRMKLRIAGRAINWLTYYRSFDIFLKKKQIPIFVLARLAAMAFPQ